jgi:hypothetical protein
MSVYHYWKLKFPCRGKTDREMQNTDRKIKILIFLSVYRQENTARNKATGK